MSNEEKEYIIRATYQNPMVQKTLASSPEEALEKAKANPNGWTKQAPTSTDLIHWNFSVEEVSSKDED